jgi:hypothetical protein
VVVIALVAMLVVGCSSDMDGPSPVRIDNHTSGPLDVSLHWTSSDGVDHPGSVESIPAGGAHSFFGPLHDRCLTGTFVATRNGQTLATIEKPCTGSHWEITDDGASQTSS